MTLVVEYASARREELLARLRRVFALRAMTATGMTQRAIGAELGITQPAVSQQLNADIQADSATRLRAAAPVLKSLATARGFTDLKVFGSVARGTSRPDSDVDLLVRPPADATISDLLDLQELFTSVLDRPVDIVSVRGLKAGVDDDVLRDAIAL